MREKSKAVDRRINWVQISIGVVVLVVGSLIYLIDRPPDHTYFIYSSPINISLSNTLPNLFGSIGNSLPAFLHVFSFILITAGLIFCNKKGYLIICLSWFLIDSAFEVGQKFTAWSTNIIPDWFAGIPFLENTENYFLQGTFDILDLIAIAFGSVIAYLVLLRTNSANKEIQL
jgi:ABC-type xylose transport system permease subunit